MWVERAACDEERLMVALQGVGPWAASTGRIQTPGNWGWSEAGCTMPYAHPLAPGAEEERQDLTAALGLVKELLSNVDQDVHELEKGARLQEIYNRMDPRAQAPVPGKGPFGREELLRRKLIHDGCLLWKTATGRFKGQ